MKKAKKLYRRYIGVAIIRKSSGSRSGSNGGGGGTDSGTGIGTGSRSRGKYYFLTSM